MRIAVNTRLLLQNKMEGIGWFAYESLKRITQQHPEHQFFFFFDRPYNKEFIFAENVTPVVLSPQARHPFLYYLWFEWTIPRALKKVKADVFLSPDGFLPLSTKVKTIPVIHDLNFEYYPESIPLLTRIYYKYYFPKFAKKAMRIATVSEYSKADIIKHYGIASHKIDVVYNGANDIYSPVSNEIRLHTKAKYSNGFEYFLFIGAMHPRKNIAMLLNAFDKFRKIHSSNIKLVLVGQKKWWTKEISDAYEAMQFKNDVVFTGRLDNNDLKNVLASALALTYIPYFEGFGIPIVEAFYSGTPVITSNITSMPEVAGDAALLVNPFSIDDVCNAMMMISSNQELRKNLIESGLERAKLFSWQQTADKLWACIEKAISQL
jgi:glycosyltransferase involved in cell wall biosynthesis